MNDTHASAYKEKSASWSDLFSKENSLKAILLLLGVMLHAINVYLATTVMPSVVQEIGELEYYSWNTTLFVVASIVGSVISANQMTKSGPRKAYQTGILLFSAGTLICTVAPAMYILLLGRFVQGFGGGLLFALSYAMIRIIFTENLWARAMALVSGMWGIAAFSGPLLGGIFAEYGHWRWSFGSLLILCIFIFIIATAILPKKRSHETATPVPYLKLLLLGLSALSISIGSVQKTVTANLLGIVIAGVFLCFLLVAEKKNNNRLLPAGAYKISAALGQTYSMMALLMMAASVEIYVPYFAQTIYHFSPVEAGYLGVLMSVGWTIGSISFSGKKGKSVNTIIAWASPLMLLGLSSLGYISFVNASSSNWNTILMSVFLFAIGVGIGMAWPHLLTRVFSLSPKGEENLTSSSITTVQLMATSFGAALAGLVTNLAGITDPGGVIGATKASVFLYGTFAAAPLGAMLIFIFSKRKADNLF